MRSIAQLAFMSVTTLLIVYVAVNPQWGLVYRSPVSALGIGAIGLGLMIEARKRMRPVKAHEAAGGTDGPKA